MVEIKFCGMTRPEDVREAVSLGATYAGAIFAESPRRVTPSEAVRVLASAHPAASRVAVFGPSSAEAIARDAALADVDVVQVHGDPSPELIEAIRALWQGTVWAVLRVTTSIPSSASDLFDIADGVVLDARVDGKLGGTGVALPWERLATGLRDLRGRAARLILAGGLTPSNVAGAIVAIEPDVVDVSSGVEVSPGVKDHALMRAFRDAVRAGVHA